MKSNIMPFSKKGMNAFFLVVIISLLIWLAISLVIWYPAIKGGIEQSTQGPQECSFELLLRSIMQAGSFGSAQVPIQCHVKKRTITLKNLETYYPLAKQATANYEKTNPELAESYPNNEEGWLLWSYSKTIADEMVNCFNKGWKGQINLRQAGLMGIYDQTKGNICLYCARLEYAPEVKELDLYLSPYKNKENKDVFILWLNNNYINQQTYYDYLVPEPKPVPLLALSSSQIRTSDATSIILMGDANGDAYAIAMDRKNINQGILTNLYCAKMVNDI